MISSHQRLPPVTAGRAPTALAQQGRGDASLVRDAPCASYVGGQGNKKMF